MRHLSLLFAGTLLIGGCSRASIMGADTNVDYLTTQSVAAINNNLDAELPQIMSVAGTRADRDRYITGKMFVIDRNYNYYEQNLTKTIDYQKLFGSLATIGMSAAATVIPLGETTKVLNSTITAVQGAQTAIDQEVLQSQALQSIERQMRADRANQAKVIYDRMKKCDISQYTIFIALSDVEAYRHAGTFESALASLGRTTAAAETAALNNKNSTSSDPGSGASTANTNAYLLAATLAPFAPDRKDTVCPIYAK